MKKIPLSLVAVLSAILLFAQSPQAFKYQTIVRDNAGEILANQNVSFQISILEGSATGTVAYVERHDTITNEFGLVNLEIGNGDVVSGYFADIDWGGDSYFLQVELDEEGESNYQLMGTSQLLAVPYSLYSGTTGDTTRWKKNNDNLYFSGGNVGIGTMDPKTKMEINALIRLTPSLLADPCNPDLEGSIYYDDYLKEYCYCDGIHWKQMDGAGYCQCVDLDNDGFDNCDPNHIYDTDGMNADCNDSIPDINPGEDEICDNIIDDDCDGLIDSEDPDCNFCSGMPNGTPCDDGDPCTENDQCINGICQGAPIICPPIDQCHGIGTCDQGNCVYEPLPNGTPCNDGDDCTTNDECNNGTCQGIPYSCDDSKPCTADICDGDGTCQNILDPAWCLIEDSCYPDGALNPINSCEECNAALSQNSWTPVTSGTSCEDDGHPCTSDICDGAGSCHHVPDAGWCFIDGICYEDGDRNPNNSCQECNSSANQTLWTPLPNGTNCEDDGYPCTSDICDGAGSCHHVPDAGWCFIDGICYEDGDRSPNYPCQECNSSANQTSWTPLPNGTNCDDANACTENDECQNMICQGTPVDCDDEDPYTFDFCDSETGCYYVSNNEPVASFTANPNPANPGQNISFDASGSYDADGGDYITNYEWDWDDDGTFDESSSSPTTSHQFGASGFYDVTLRVTDNPGLTDEMTITIEIL